MITIKESVNSYKEFVTDKMASVSSEYTDEDIELAFSLDHIIITATIDNKIVAFCLLLKPLEEYYVSYTWSEATVTGRKAFIKGIDYLVENYPEVKFTDYAYSGEHEKTMQKAYNNKKER